MMPIAHEPAGSWDIESTLPLDRARVHQRVPDGLEVKCALRAVLERHDHPADARLRRAALLDDVQSAWAPVELPAVRL
jgi:hypothetical protein